MLLSSLALAAANAAADAPGTRDRGAPLPPPPLLLPPDSGGMEPAPAAAPLCGALEEAMTAAAICSAVTEGGWKKVKGAGVTTDQSISQAAWGTADRDRTGGAARRRQQHAPQGTAQHSRLIVQAEATSRATRQSRRVE